jgi:hypothetical protein
MRSPISPGILFRPGYRSWPPWFLRTNSDGLHAFGCHEIPGDRGSGYFGRRPLGRYVLQPDRGTEKPCLFVRRARRTL